MKKDKIVVAYSGGLDTSIMVKWLSEKYDAEIITVTGNLGQRMEELDDLEEKAKKTGASKSYVVDLQKEFITGYVWPALKAGALYEGVYPLACAIGRPLLAKKLVEIALLEQATHIAHGCTGKGNDQVRFEVGIQTLAPHIQIIAPVREWEFSSREEEIEYAIEHKIPCTVTKKRPYSIDDNLWGIAVECGALEDPTLPPPEDAFQITRSPSLAPDTAENVTIHFTSGEPDMLNDTTYNPVSLVKELNTLAGNHGIGRIDMIENRIVGIKSREIYEAPAAVVLHRAHSELEKMILDKETFRFKQTVSTNVANVIYDGLWFSPLFEAMMQFVNATQKYITGTVTLQLYKGTITVLSRDSNFSLYAKDLATYSVDDTFDHRAATGFLKLYGLPYKTRSQIINAFLVKDPHHALG